MKKLLLFFLASLSFAQTPPYNLQISQQPLPIVGQIAANKTNCSTGGSTFYYWVIARYGVGNANPSVAGIVANIQTGGACQVVVGWGAPASPTTSALTYDVLRTTTNYLTGTCTNCLLQSASSSLTVTDTFTALGSYTLRSYNNGTPGTLALDNVDSSSLLFTFNGITICTVSNVSACGSNFISSLTTNGTSGAATVNSGILNIPQYSGGSPSGPAGLTAVYGGTGTLSSSPAVIYMSKTGFVADDTTDNTSTLNTLLAAATADKDFFCDVPGKYLFSGQIVIPNYDAATPVAHHYNFHIHGVGNYFPWSTPSGPQVNGCTFDLRYKGFGGGQIQSLGYGQLEINDLAINPSVTPTTAWTIGDNLTSIVITGVYPNQTGTVTVTTPTQTLAAGNYVQVLGSLTAELNTTYQVAANVSGTQFTITPIPFGITSQTYTDAGMSVTYTAPLIYATNTLIRLHDLYIKGDASLGLTTNNQDVLVLGGGTNSVPDNTINSSFNGFGGGAGMWNVQFDYIRRFVYARNGAQQLYFANLYGDPTTVGSNDTVAGSAVEEFAGAGGNTYIVIIPAGAYAHGFLLYGGGQDTILGTQNGDNCCSGKTMYQIGSGSSIILGNRNAGAATCSVAGNLVMLAASTNIVEGCNGQDDIGVGNPTAAFIVHSLGGGYPALYSNGVTPSGTNYALIAGNGGDTYLNGTSDVYIGIGGVLKEHVTATVHTHAEPYQDTTIYTAAGTAVPTCNSGAKGTKLVVGDAATPTYLGTYASGGAIATPAMCDGTNWVTY